MEWVVAFGITLFVVCVAGYALWLNYRKKAEYFAVTLVRNQGSFVGLCIKRRYGTWTFVDVKVMPSNPGAPVSQAAPGELYVPYRNILYYQEIANVAE